METQPVFEKLMFFSLFLSHFWLHFCLIFLKNESHEHHLYNVMYVEQILVKGITAAQ